MRSNVVNLGFAMARVNIVDYNGGVPSLLHSVELVAPHTENNETGEFACPAQSIYISQTGAAALRDALNFIAK